MLNFRAPDDSVTVNLTISIDWMENAEEDKEMMRWILGIPCLIIFVVLIGFEAQIIFAGEVRMIDLGGILTGADGKPVANAKVTIMQDAKTVRAAVSNKEGRFSVRGVSPGLSDITFSAPGYSTIEEKGVVLEEKMDLSRTLQEKSAGGWWALLLLVPGVLGLWVAYLKEAREKSQNKKKNNSGRSNEGRTSTEDPKTSGGGSVLEPQLENRFTVAVLSGLIWLGTLVLLARFGELGSGGVYKVSLFHQSLAFDFYIPILGFVGALLYVLDLFRRGSEAFPKGTEFGMRLIMGPYVAIVMVALFGNDLGLMDLTSPIAKGVLAFFSGLLVVVALQGLTERGNEWLGRWRQEARYEPSEIAKTFGLSKEEDLTLRKAGMRFLIQLRGRKEDELRAEVRKVGFDENLALGFKTQLEKEQLRTAIGDFVWERLKEIRVNTVEEFAHLDDAKLQEIAGMDPKLQVDGLENLRDKAKKFIEFP